MNVRAQPRSPRRQRRPPRAAAGRRAPQGPSDGSRARGAGGGGLRPELAAPESAEARGPGSGRRAASTCAGGQAGPAPISHNPASRPPLPRPPGQRLRGADLLPFQPGPLGRAAAVLAVTPALLPGPCPESGGHRQHSRGDSARPGVQRVSLGGMPAALASHPRAHGGSLRISAASGTRPRPCPPRGGGSRGPRRRPRPDAPAHVVLGGRARLGPNGGLCAPPQKLLGQDLQGARGLVGLPEQCAGGPEPADPPRPGQSWRPRAH